MKSKPHSSVPMTKAAKGKVLVKPVSRPNHGTMKRAADADPQVDVAAAGDNGRPISGETRVSHPDGVAGTAASTKPSVDQEKALKRIKVCFDAYNKHGVSALKAAREMGGLLKRIKADIKAKGLSWRAWCKGKKDAGELPFGVRQADRYIQLHSESAKFEGQDCGTIRAGLALVTHKDKAPPQQKPDKEKWVTAYEGDSKSVQVSSKGMIRIALSSPELGDLLSEAKNQSELAEMKAVRAETAALADSQGMPPEAKIPFVLAAERTATCQLQKKKAERRHNASKAIETVFRAFARCVADATVADKLAGWLDKMESSRAKAATKKK